MSERKFYRNVISIIVLSEEKLGDCLSLSEVDYAITDGCCLGGGMVHECEELTQKECADLCYELGSDPGFFQLEDETSPH